MSRQSEAWVGTYTGKKFFCFSPRVMDVDIEDIAHSLARQCRFNGHCATFYSVAEHSIEVSHLVSGQDALWGLLHDAAEAYVSDIVRPIKPFLAIRGGEMVGYFRDMEAGILQLIGKRFGLAWPVPPSIEVADLRMLATERQQLFDDRQPPWSDLEQIEPYPIRLQLDDPVRAEAKFRHRFRELTR